LNYRILTSLMLREEDYLITNHYLYEMVARINKFRSVNFVAYHIFNLDLMHDTFLDQNLVHNTFLDMDLVHNTFLTLYLNMVHNIFLDLDLVHNTSTDVVHDRRDGSKECSQCMRNVHGSKDD